MKMWNHSGNLVLRLSLLISNANRHLILSTIIDQIRCSWNMLLLLFPLKSVVATFIHRRTPILLCVPYVCHVCTTNMRPAAQQHTFFSIEKRQKTFTCVKNVHLSHRYLLPIMNIKSSLSLIHHHHPLPYSLNEKKAIKWMVIRDLLLQGK